MPKVSNSLLIVFIACVSAANHALACQVDWRSPAELEQEAEAIVVAQIISARHVTSSFRGEDYEYDVKIAKTERGGIQPGQTRVTYEDLKAHVRGQTRVCPLKNGSGIEHDLKPNQKYRLYLKSAADPEILLARLLLD